MKHKPSVKVFLVDDHPAMREGVHAYLAAQTAIAVVGEAADAAEALRRIKKAAPDVIVLDINLPGTDGGELARRLRQTVPRAKLLAFSFHDDREHVVRMARCGAHGYVTKGMPTSALLEAIRRVHEGGLSFPPDMADDVLVRDSEAAGESSSELTERERDVLTLLAEGLANKQVARRLGISVRTAETHRQHLSRKLGIAPVAGLTKYAIQQGLTPLSLDPAPSLRADGPGAILRP